MAPYGNDEWLAESEKAFRVAEQRVARENDAYLRQRLRDKYGVAPEFMDLAVRIWWDGKED